MPVKTILVVEDDPSILLDASAAIEQAGFEVQSFDNADDALSFVFEQADKVAAIFTDVQMPGHLDGLVLAEIVGRHWPHVRVLMTSGRVQPYDDLPPNVSFIPKPWLPSRIVAALRDAVPA